MRMFNGLEGWFSLSQSERRILQTPRTKDDIIKEIGGWNLKNNGVIASEFRFKKGEWQKWSRAYVFPCDSDEFIQDLAEASLTHTILSVGSDWYECKIYLSESKDGSTNIDADVLDALNKAIGMEDI